MHAATAKERDSALLELEALRKEKESMEECLEAMSQDLDSKQDELSASVVRYSLASMLLIEFSKFNKMKRYR